MKILTCIVTHDRLDYTKRTIESWLETTKHASPSPGLVIVDNASSDDTREYLQRYVGRCPVVFNQQNLFPGAATNIGWHEYLKQGDADLLHRSDNDIEYLPGWYRAVEQKFTELPHLGQLGILNAHEDYPGGPPWTERWGLYHTLPGGNCVIRRELWEEGFRWEAGRWQPGGNDEDTKATLQIQQNGWLVGRLVETVAHNISFHRFNEYPAYYRTTAALRGLVPETSV